MPNFLTYWTAKRFWIAMSSAIILLLSLSFLFSQNPTHAYERTETLGNGQFSIRLNRSHLYFPGDCLQLNLESENIKSFRVVAHFPFNNLDNETRDICSGSRELIFAVEANDGATQDYEIPLERVFVEPVFVLSLLLSVLSATVCAYQVFRFSGLVFCFSLILAIPITMINSSRLPDFPIHLSRIETILATDDYSILSPHFLFHLATIIFTKLTNLSVQYSAIIVLLLSQAMLSLLIYFVIKRFVQGNKRGFAFEFILAILAILLPYVGPISLFFPASQIGLTSGFIFPNVYHSPTMTVMRPFAMALFFILITVPETQSRKTLFYLLGIAILVMLTTVAKPNYTIIIVPAYIALNLLDFILNRKLARTRVYSIIALFVPAIAVLAWQYFYTFGADSSFAIYENDKIIFAPFLLFQVWDVSLAEAMSQLIASIVFPVLVYLVYMKSFSQNHAMNLAWISFGGSLAIIHLFAQTPRTSAGNFVWGTEIALLVLFACSVGALMNQASLSSKLVIKNWRFVLIMFSLGLHILIQSIFFFVSLRI